jgi:hypothetical protein
MFQESQRTNDEAFRATVTEPEETKNDGPSARTLSCRQSDSIDFMVIMQPVDH